MSVIQSVAGLSPDVYESCNDSADSEVMWQRFSVPYEYTVCFTDGLFNTANELFANTLSRHEPDKRHRLIVFIDQGVADASPATCAAIKNYCSEYSEQLDLTTPPILTVGGESIKADWKLIEQMQQTLVDHHIDRHSYIVAIGGGALLDAVGLVAATAHRGIRHVRVPTTVLAQNDSGVGVKNGINLFSQKNYLGTFSPPFAVLNDYGFIRTLPPRDKIAGIAEAVKVALIRDTDFFQYLQRNAHALATFEQNAMQYMIMRSAQLHMRQIATGGDPFETGSARPLDFGHWAAHKLETLTAFELRHGEAVAIGLALDARYSVLAGLLSQGCEIEICNLLEQLGFKLWHQALGERDASGAYQVLAGLNEFREHLGGELTITLLQAVGVGVEVHSMDESLVAESIQWLRVRQQ